MRKMWIGGALAATLMACYFAPDDDGDVIAPASARAYTVTAAPIAVQAPALEIHPRLDDEDLGNPFAKQTWQAATPKQVIMAQAEQRAVKVAQSAAGAPALPIRLLGRYVDEGKAAYFLQVGERNVLAHIGDRVDDNYTLDSVNGDALTFTYLPLHQQQVLAAGDTN
jgi:hypothetical protein